MTKMKNHPVPPLELQRGTPSGSMIWNDWDTILVRADRNRSHPIEPDVVIDRLVKSGQISTAIRDVGTQLFAGKLKPPAGKWALLIQFKGQPWLCLAPSWRDFGTAGRLAEEAGLTTLLTGYQGTAGVSFLEVHHGKNMETTFSSCGFTQEALKIPKSRRDALANTQFRSNRHKNDWWRKFSSEAQVRDALVRELDAYAPMIIVSGAGGKVELEALDDAGQFSHEHFARVDLLVFGPAEALDANEHSEQLKKAIEQGDPEAAQAAIAAGASITVLPNSSRTPLETAIQALDIEGADKRIQVVRVLLEANADVNRTGTEEPLICMLANRGLLDEQSLIEALRLLLDRGVDPYTRTSPRHVRPNSPLVHELALGNRRAALKFLLTRGVDLMCLDGEGRTALQCLEIRLNSMIKMGISNVAGERQAIRFLQAVQEGREDGSGYEELAAADRRRHERGWRETRRAFAGLVDTFKRIEKVQSKPTKRNVASLALVGLLDKITVINGARRQWGNRVARDGAQASLKKEGYRRVGLFALKELPVVMLAMLHPAEHVYAVISEDGSTRWIDLVRFHVDGSRVTVTNAKVAPEARFSSPTIRKKRLPGATVARLVREMRGEKPPHSGVEEIHADEFAKRFEYAYRQEMRARRSAERKADRSEKR